MTLTLRPITVDNWEQCLDLHVKPEQAGFVASNAYSLAQAAYEDDCVPRAIYAAEAMVGFLMYWHLPPDTVYHISRLMVDAAYQGQGYGRGALELLIEELKAHADCAQIEITYEPTNERARTLYLALGFVETGEFDDGEAIALLDCGARGWTGMMNTLAEAVDKNNDRQHEIDISIRPVQPSDAAEWLRMRVALWPDEPEKEAVEIAHFLSTTPRSKLPELHEAFVCVRPDGKLCGLVEVSTHTSVPGCETDHIGYLEAWYVDPEWRNQGVGRSLAEQAEAWARAQGCREMASDTTPSYPLSPAAHAALGYEEVERYFRKELS